MESVPRSMRAMTVTTHIRTRRCRSKVSRGHKRKRSYLVKSSYSIDEEQGFLPLQAYIAVTVTNQPQHAEAHHTRTQATISNTGWGPQTTTMCVQKQPYAQLNQGSIKNVWRTVKESCTFSRSQFNSRNFVIKKLLDQGTFFLFSTLHLGRWADSSPQFGKVEI